jgi:hypothetical protein
MTRGETSAFPRLMRFGMAASRFAPRIPASRWTFAASHPTATCATCVVRASFCARRSGPSSRSPTT